MRVDNAVNIADLEVLARRRLPKVIFDFMDGSAEDGQLRATAGFERYRFRPRLLTGNASAIFRSTCSATTRCRS
jgi:isopentenyl diphosphate isomerase/L-lactate dehydrogenase-like FMN-dependent dehydrogenase